MNRGTVSLKAHCDRCRAELEVRGGVRVGDVVVFVVPVCSCNGSPRQGRMDGRAGVAAPAQKTR